MSRLQTHEEFKDEIERKFAHAKAHSSIINHSYWMQKLHGWDDKFLSIFIIVQQYEAMQIAGRQLAEHNAPQINIVDGKLRDYLLSFAIDYASREQQIEDHHFIIDMKQLLLCDDKFAKELMEAVKTCRKDLIIVTE